MTKKASEDWINLHHFDGQYGFPFTQRQDVSDAWLSLYNLTPPNSEISLSINGQAIRCKRIEGNRWRHRIKDFFWIHRDDKIAFLKAANLWPLPITAKEYTHSFGDILAELGNNVDPHHADDIKTTLTEKAVRNHSNIIVDESTSLNYCYGLDKANNDPQIYVNNMGAKILRKLLAPKLSQEQSTPENYISFNDIKRRAHIEMQDPLFTQFERTLRKHIVDGVLRINQEEIPIQYHQSDNSIFRSELLFPVKDELTIMRLFGKYKKGLGMPSPPSLDTDDALGYRNFER